MSSSNEAEAPTGAAARLARPNILALHPYRCARDDYSEGVLLDANENAIGPTSLPTNSLDPRNNHLELERYPSPYQIPLKELYGAYRGGLRPDQIFVGVGSDEAIDLLIRIFCKPGEGNDCIMTTPPTYGMYKVCANVNDVDIVNVPLTSGSAHKISSRYEKSFYKIISAFNNPLIWDLIFEINSVKSRDQLVPNKARRLWAAWSLQHWA